MKTFLFALAGAAVALTAVPAEARHYGHHWARGHVTRTVCTRHRHATTCVARTHAVRTAMVANGRRYRVGYVFGPNYSYVPVTQLPQPIVTRYSLSPDYRYVQSGPYIYVVDPTTYAVTRVLNSIVH
jgi:hypothetical protein